jgi:type IV pilus assembly protein PilA
MLTRIRERLTREEGFTLIELLVVIVIIGILLAIAVPSYLGFRDRANRSAAQSNLRSAVPSAEAYYSDNNTYAQLHTGAVVGGGVPNGMKFYDSGLSADVAVSGTPDADCYVLTSTHGGFTYYFKGPGGSVTATAPAAC